MVLEQSVALVCWGLFLVYWAINIPLQKKAVVRFGLRGHLKYRILGGLGGILLAVSLVVNLKHLVVYSYYSVIVAVISIIFSVVGSAIAIWARRSLAGNWSATLDFKEQHQLVTSGPYKFVRHPIYTGMLFMYAGIALAFVYWTGLLGVLFLFWAFCERIKNEEALLSNHFPKEYKSYKARTKALIPYIF